ncbi:MAG: hypothetical protein ACE5GL_11225 [Calditrichia bacterium]
MSMAVKPPSLIATEQTTTDRDGKEIIKKISGRNVPRICSGIIPVVEAIPALVLL